MRGYYGIGVYHLKKKNNLGTLWRSANTFGASFIFTIGRRYDTQASDTLKTPRHIPLYHYSTFEEFLAARPMNCPLVGVEMDEQSLSLPEYRHPERCIYLLGAEDHGLSVGAMESCSEIVQIPTAKAFCLNVATAGSLLMYDRFSKLCTSTNQK